MVMQCLNTTEMRISGLKDWHYKLTSITSLTLLKVYENFNLKYTANVFAIDFTGFPCVSPKPCKVQVNITGKGLKHNSP